MAVTTRANSIVRGKCWPHPPPPRPRKGQSRVNHVLPGFGEYEGPRGIMELGPNFLGNPNYRPNWHQEAEEGHGVDWHTPSRRSAEQSRLKHCQARVPLAELSITTRLSTLCKPGAAEPSRGPNNASD